MKGREEEGKLRHRRKRQSRGGGKGKASLVPRLSLLCRCPQAGPGLGPAFLAWVCKPSLYFILFSPKVQLVLARLRLLRKQPETSSGWAVCPWAGRLGQPPHPRRWPEDTATAGLAVPVPGDQAACHLTGESSGPLWANGLAAALGGPRSRAGGAGAVPAGSVTRWILTHCLCQAPAGHLLITLSPLDSAAALGG